MRTEALEFSFRFHGITTPSITDTGVAQIIGTAQQFADFLEGKPYVAFSADAPSAKPARKKKDDPAPVAETSDKQPLEPTSDPVTEDPKPETAVEAVDAGPVAATPAAPIATTITRDDMLAEATLFSQHAKGGTEGLASVLKGLGYEKFSAVPAERYAEFSAALNAHLAEGDNPLA